MMALKMTAERMAECGLSSFMMLSVLRLREHALEHGRDDGEVLGHVVGDREGGERARG